MAVARPTIASATTPTSTNCPTWSATTPRPDRGRSTGAVVSSGASVTKTEGRGRGLLDGCLSGAGLAGPGVGRRGVDDVGTGRVGDVDPGLERAARLPGPEVAVDDGRAVVGDR